MKKLLGIVVLGLLLSGNAYAVKYKSLFNFYIDLPEEYILSSSLTPELIAKYSKNNSEQNELIKASRDATDLNLEMIIRKDKMLQLIKPLDDEDIHISISSFVIKKWTRDWSQNCNINSKVFENINKNKKEPMRDFRCEFFGIPNVVYPYENSSILVSYVDPNLLSKFIYEHWFRLPNSENVITIDLICEKNCKETLPVLDHIINSITFN